MDHLSKYFRWNSIRLVISICLAFNLWSAPLAAHESRPAYLQLQETSEGQFDLFWRTPVLSGMRLPVRLVLPDSVQDRAVPVTQRLTDSLIERRRIDAGPLGHAGARIDFVGLQATITDVLVQIEWLNGAVTSTIIRPKEPWIIIGAQQGAWDVAFDYAGLGLEHILLGFDHLLFVLALVLITNGTWRLIKTVTAFTVAHSLTLGLASLGIVNFPSRSVETVIALSIVFLAMEIVHVKRGNASLTARAPWIVAFGFGLLHGLGFAGALADIGLTQGYIPVALLFFNVGVEVGQLLFIAAVLGVLAMLRLLPLAWPRHAEMLLPYGIGSIAMLWVFERVFTI